MLIRCFLCGSCMMVMEVMEVIKVVCECVCVTCAVRYRVRPAVKQAGNRTS